MTITPYSTAALKSAHLVSDQILMGCSEEAVQLMVDCYYQGFDRIILQRENIHVEFFDLKNGMAGEILQKFANYRMQLRIIGDFATTPSPSLHAFIAESNRGRTVRFVKDLEEALQ